MTIALLAQSGVDISWKEDIITVAEFTSFSGREMVVEADWSSASFWYETAALSQTAGITISGLKQDSIQGDAILPKLFSKLGVKTSFLPGKAFIEKIAGEDLAFQEIDFSSYPDLAQPVIMTCAALGLGGKFSGLESLRVKETDRITALQNELQKLGGHFEEGGPGQWLLQPGPLKIPAGQVFETYEDHRMAMSIAPLACLGNDLVIRDPDVVSKSYPSFWDELGNLGFKMDLQAF